MSNFHQNFQNSPLTSEIFKNFAICKKVSNMKLSLLISIVRLSALRTIIERLGDDAADITTPPSTRTWISSANHVTNHVIQLSLWLLRLQDVDVAFSVVAEKATTTTHVVLARYCYSKLSVRPSVRPSVCPSVREVVVSWAYMLS